MMAVDALRETRHINRIRAQDLSALWTAQSYRPDITSAVAAVRRLASWLPLGSMCSEPIAQGRTPIYSTEDGGYPCIKTKHINGLIIDESDPDWVTLECASSLAKFKVAQSTVLMNRSGAGSIGRCSVYLGTAAPLTNEHVLHIRVAAPHDPCFVAAYLSSWWGERAIEQGVTGSTGQLNLANEHVSRVPVPALSPDAQRYVGDKIRQAERLRERARSLEVAARVATVKLVGHRSNAQDAVQNLLLAIAGKQAERLDPDEGSTHRRGVLRSRVAPAAMFGRLNAEAYQQEFLDNDRLLRASGWTLTRLGDLVTAPINNSIRGVTEHLSPDHRGVPMFRPADIEGLWMNDASAPRISAAFEQEHAKARVQPGDIVLAIAGTVAAVARIGESVTYGNINGSSARVRLEAPLRGVVLLFLASSFGHRELMRWAVGSVQKHLNLEDLTEVRVPVPPVELCEPFESALQLSGRAYEGSKALLATAISVVEQLIDGQVSEGHLIAAQKALEAGDRSADRDILKALRQSDAPDAKPLISDLDALYALLDESAEEENEG
ncbi:hypothetical protein WME99_47325 [Sorangium sp. So ce136]|uniref:hypothetical protein n=1 Tax=Sorangium sp. So ce136 TaxID=3133284 RepID=UPI003EFDB9D3